MSLALYFQSQFTPSAISEFITMTLSVHPIHAFTDNYLWSIEDQAEQQCLIVDPGDANAVNAYLEQSQLKLSGILVTHHHPDHIGGVAKLKEQHHCTVFANKAEGFAFTDTPVSEGDTLELLGSRFEVIATPGHTLKHIVYYSPSDTLHSRPWLFCGDTLFSGGCGRLFEGSPEMMHRSLLSLAELPPSTEIYCAHEYTLANLAFALSVEPDNTQLIEYRRWCEQQRAKALPTLPSSIENELRINPFLRCEYPEIAKAMAAKGDTPLTDAVAVFAQLRRAKDHY